MPSPPRPHDRNPWRGAPSGRNPARSRRRAPRRDRLGVWCRARLARLPLSPILVVTAGLLVVVSVRGAPGDVAADPAAAPVVVATVDLPLGTVVGPDDVEVRWLARQAVPATAATATDQVLDRQVTSPIVAGEPVVAARLAPAGLVGVAAATPPGWSSFAVPVDATLPPTTVGQAVDLFALDAGTELGLPIDEARRVARAASVVAVDDQRVTVAVRAEDAPGVAAALIGSTVVLAVTGPGGAEDAHEGP